MATIHQVETEEDRAHVQDLFLEYLRWANQGLNEEFGIDFDIEAMVERDMAGLEIFMPPDGRLLLAMEGARAAGLACMKRIREDMGEIKRMYVRPEFRGQGMGRALVDTLIAEARKIGYPALRLDSTRFMAAAHALYHAAGFREIEPYPESEIPPQFHQHWVFMEKKL